MSGKQVLFCPMFNVLYSALATYALVVICSSTAPTSECPHLGFLNTHHWVGLTIYPNQVSAAQATAKIHPNPVSAALRTAMGPDYA